MSIQVRLVAIKESLNEVLARILATALGVAIVGSAYWPATYGYSILVKPMAQLSLLDLLLVAASFGGCYVLISVGWVVVSVGYEKRVKPQNPE
ncbi:MAG: hypothetical protein EXR29_14725 [Betaproteobacteria bacterium]|nr:hypothetical protein [Betaproteobacteria bacterium]